VSRRWALPGLVILAAACGDDTRLGALPVGIKASPASLEFDPTPVGLTRTLAVRLTNSGAAPLFGLTIALDGARAFGLGQPAPDTLAAGASVDLTLSFSPATTGQQTAAVRVGAIGAGKTATVALRGTGLPATNCDDGNPCTADAPALDGSCHHDPREGPCDDGNACTTDKVCVAGECLGRATSCEPPASCLSGLCDVHAGCVFVPAPGACDDGNPCTTDSCTESGCAHAEEADGTPCGPIVACASARLCLLGACVSVPIPDQTPCSDGDLCTAGDRCTNGACIGTPFTRTATLAGYEPTFGVSGAIATLLGDGRLLVLDPLPDGRGAVATVLERSGGGGGRLRRSAEIHPELTDLDRGGVAAVASGTTAGSRIAVVSTSGRVSVLDVDRSGRLEMLSSQPLLPPSLSGRPVLLAFGDAWYACVAGAGGVVAIDARDPHALSVIAQLPGEAGCSSLALDPRRAILIAGSSAGSGLARWSLADPRTPVALDEAFVGVGVQVAANGRLIAVAPSDPFLSDPTVTLLDAGDLSVRGSIVAGRGVFDEAIGDLVFTGDRLFVQTKSGLAAWDVRDPGQPRHLFDVDASGVGSFSNLLPLNVLATDGTTLVRAAEPVFGGQLLALDVSVAPRPLDAPSRGGVERLIALPGGAVYGVDRASVHALDAADPQHPMWLSGSTAPALASATLWSLGAAAGPPRLFAAATVPGIYTGAYSAIWRDGSDPAATRLLAAPFVPFQDGVLHVVDDGRRAVALSVDFAGASARVLTADLGALAPADVGHGVGPAGSLTLPTTGLDANLGTLALGGDRAVLVAIDSIADLFDTRVVATSRVFLVDVAALDRPTLLASATVAGFVTGAGVSGDRVVLLLKTSGSICCGDFVGERVVSYGLGAGSLDLEGTRPLSGGGRVLLTTTDRAVVSTQRGIAFLSLGAGGPNVVGQLDLPEPPTTVQPLGDGLWAAGPHGVGAVQPPCP
jgi:hypothetical protein